MAEHELRAGGAGRLAAQLVRKAEAVRDGHVRVHREHGRALAHLLLEDARAPLPQDRIDLEMQSRELTMEGDYRM